MTGVNNVDIKRIKRNKVIVDHELSVLGGREEPIFSQLSNMPLGSKLSEQRRISTMARQSRRISSPVTDRVEPPPQKPVVTLDKEQANIEVFVPSTQAQRRRKRPDPRYVYSPTSSNALLEKSETTQLLGNVQGSKILLQSDTQNSLDEPFSPLIV